MSYGIDVSSTTTVALIFKLGQQFIAITPGSLILTICLGLLLVVLPRKYALAPLFISGCYMTLGQVLLIGSFHFTIFRIILLFAWVRIILRNEIIKIKFNSVDKALIVWLSIATFLNLILMRWSSGALVARLGFAYNVLGIYFFVRAVLLDFNDIIQAVKILGIIIVPLAVLFAVEMFTGKNVFSVFGGVPEYSMIREGRRRCQGPFQHPIMAGTFGATSMPLFWGLWKYGGRNRLKAGAAFLSATVIVIASSSSGPLLAYIAGVAGLFFWKYRSKMKLVRRSTVIFLIAAHIIMKAPVWFLLARISDIVGGGGWYRAALIDAAVRYFNEWWFVGTTYTAHWMPTVLEIDPNMADITNQFISEGVNGGLLSMCLFIWLIVVCFKIIGLVSRAEDAPKQKQFMIWSVGCVLFSHVITFFSVTYFDQMIVFWYLLIAMIAALQPKTRRMPFRSRNFALAASNEVSR